MLPQEFIVEIENYLDVNDISLEDMSTRYEIDDRIFCSNTFNFYYGATRGCFVPRESHPSFVFKFDLEGLWEEYCANEVETYKEAVKAGLGDCFLKIEKFDYIVNTPIYICEYADETKVRKKKVTKEDLEEIAEHTSTHTKAPHIPYSWSKEFIDYYGGDKFRKFLEFLVRFGINDLHSNNLGYKDGRPVVFDFAGYFEPSSSDYDDYEESCNF